MADQYQTLHAMEILEMLKTGELIAIRNPSSRVTSNIWDQFYLIANKYKMIIPGFAQCLKCKHILGYKPASGNSNLTRHTTSELCRIKSATVHNDLKDSVIDRALLEAGNLSHPAETSQDADDSSLHIGGQLPIKLPVKQETLTSKEDYFPGSSSSDTGPSYDPPVQHDDDSHATFVDYVFQTSAQKEIGTLKSGSSRTDSLEISSKRLENEPKPGTSNEDPSAVTIVCAPDLTAVKSPQRVETTDDPLVITMAPPQPPRLKNVSFTPIRKNISKSVTITPKPAVPSSSSSTSSSGNNSASSRVSVVYFGDDPDEHTNSNIEKVLMQLRAEKLLLEMDKLKAERDKMGVEVRNIMLRRKILTLRKQLLQCGEDMAASSGPAFQHVFKQTSELSIEAVPDKSLPNVAVDGDREELQNQKGISVQLERTSQNLADTHKQMETGMQKNLIRHKSSNKDVSNTGRILPGVQNKNSKNIKKSSHQNILKSQKKTIENEGSDGASASCFTRLVGSGEVVRVKVEAEDPDRLKKVGIFYETSGEGLDIDRRLSVDGFSEACGAIGTCSSLNTSSFSETCAVEGTSLAETCSNPSILETRLLGAPDRHWDPSESRGGGGISDMGSNSYPNLTFKRLGEFEDRGVLHRDISEHNADDVLAKRKRIEDEFGLIHMDMT